MHRVPCKSFFIHSIVGKKRRVSPPEMVAYYGFSRVSFTYRVYSVVLNPYMIYERYGRAPLREIIIVTQNTFCNFSFIRRLIDLVIVRHALLFWALERLSVYAKIKFVYSRLHKQLANFYIFPRLNWYRVPCAENFNVIGCCAVPR